MYEVRWYCWLQRYLLGVSDPVLGVFVSAGPVRLTGSVRACAYSWGSVGQGGKAVLQTCILFFWDSMPRHWVTLRMSSSTFRSLKDETITLSRHVRIPCPVIHCHIRDERDPQLHCRENLGIHTQDVLKWRNKWRKINFVAKFTTQSNCNIYCVV
jgi:hypothetical protein